MAYKVFEHDSVKYKLFLGNHVSSSYPMINNSGGLKDLDVLILENGIGNLETMMNWIKETPQYKEIFARIPGENPNITIYDTDFPCSIAGFAGSLAEGGLSTVATYYGATVFKKEKISRREILEGMGKVGVGILGLSFFGNLINGFYNKEDIKVISEANAIRSSVLPTPRIGFRNAVIAKIVKEYIVPNEMRSGGELNIGILFGAGHSGIEHNIKNKWLRDTTIEAYESFGYPATSKDDLNRVRKLTYQDSKYIGEELFLDLF